MLSVPLVLFAAARILSIGEQMLMAPSYKGSLKLGVVIITKEEVMQDFSI